MRDLSLSVELILTRLGCLDGHGIWEVGSGSEASTLAGNVMSVRTTTKTAERGWAERDGSDSRCYLYAVRRVTEAVRGRCMQERIPPDERME